MFYYLICYMRKFFYFKLCVSLLHELMPRFDKKCFGKWTNIYVLVKNFVYCGLIYMHTTVTGFKNFVFKIKRCSVLLIKCAVYCEIK